jgi:Mrp family chromosome partitioning ATPase
MDVVPVSGDSTSSHAVMSGLVQYLVFEGQAPKKLIVPTRIPTVEYMPAGGPYPVTDALASDPMSELVQEMRRQYSLILVVGPAIARGTDTEILASYADGVVFVVNGSLSSVTPAVETFFRSLKETNVALLGSILCV